MVATYRAILASEAITFTRARKRGRTSCAAKKMGRTSCAEGDEYPRDS